MENDSSLARCPALPQLPHLIRAFSGAEFDPHVDRWAYRDNLENVSLNFGSIDGVTPDFVAAMKLVFAWYAENQSAGSLVQNFGRVLHLLKSIRLNHIDQISTITSIDLINYRSMLDHSNFWYMSSLASVLKRWHRLGVPGISEDAVNLLRHLKLKGMQKGVAVLTMDPQSGPFTDIELQAIQSALNDAYAVGDVPLDYYLLAWLLMLLGQRPVQYAALKVCDLVVGKANDGTQVYTLRVPRAKQRGKMLRAEFKERILTPQIGEMLFNYAGQIEHASAVILTDPKQAPLFPQKEESEAAPAEFAYHRTSGALMSSLSVVLDKLNVKSERTGKPLQIFPTRFRRTIGTRAAAEGHGALIVAELLDHSDTQNVGVYVQSTPEMLDRIDRSMAMVTAPMAQAFAGTLIHDESEAVRGNDPRSRIVDPRFDTSFKPMGNCGSYSFCGFSAPIACYTCRNFQPWLDGPHETVLAHLISERERLKESADLRIASVNDRTIFAVAQVIIQCQKTRGEIDEGVGHG